MKLALAYREVRCATILAWRRDMDRMALVPAWLRPFEVATSVVAFGIIWVALLPLIVLWVAVSERGR